jgi:hypothetical protein
VYISKSGHQQAEYQQPSIPGTNLIFLYFENWNLGFGIFCFASTNMVLLRHHTGLQPLIGPLTQLK